MAFKMASHGKVIKKEAIQPYSLRFIPAFHSI